DDSRIVRAVRDRWEPRQYPRTAFVVGDRREGDRHGERTRSIARLRESRKNSVVVVRFERNIALDPSTLRHAVFLFSETCVDRRPRWSGVGGFVAGKTTCTDVHFRT